MSRFDFIGASTIVRNWCLWSQQRLIWVVLEIGVILARVELIELDIDVLQKQGFVEKKESRLCGRACNSKNDTQQKHYIDKWADIKNHVFSFQLVGFTTALLGERLLEPLILL